MSFSSKNLRELNPWADLWWKHVVIAAADELDRLNAEIARLREALKDARNNGLIYWEPRTERGHVSKAQMLSRIDAALAEQGEK